MNATTQRAPMRADLVTAVCAAIREVTEGYGGLQRLAYAAGIPAATIKRYRAGREPSGGNLLRLMRANDRLRAEILSALEHP